ncbi:MAG: hypothetical protein ACJ8LG_02925 [Massilia sp.]
MSLQHTALALAAGLLAAAAAQAQVGITADVGTTGLGAHIVVPMESYLNGRFGLNYLKHDFNRSSGMVDYNLNGKLQTFDALVDWYPREGNSFRLTGGVVYNGSKFDVKANADKLGKFSINGVQYSAADVGVLKGKVDFRKAAPYLGIGWGNALAPAHGSWNFNADLGAFYQGKANVNLASIGCTTSQLVCTKLAEDVAAERLRLADEASSYKFYPVLRASVSYRF